MNSFRDNAVQSLAQTLPDTATRPTFGRILAAAMRRFWTNIGYVLLAGLIVAAFAGAVQVVFYRFYSACVGAANWGNRSPEVVRTILWVIASAGSVVCGLLTIPLLESYKWAVIRSFDRPHLAFQDFAEPFRVRSLGTVILLVLLLTVLGTTLTSVLHLWPREVGTPASPAFHLTFCASWYLMRLLTLMLVPAAIILPQPTFIGSLRGTWRILRGQPLRMAVIAALYYGLGYGVGYLVNLLQNSVTIPDAIAGSVWALCYQLLYLVPLAVGVHLVAALFRAAAGYPLEPPDARPNPANDPSPPTLDHSTPEDTGT